MQDRGWFRQDKWRSWDQGVWVIFIRERPGNPLKQAVWTRFIVGFLSSWCHFFWHLYTYNWIPSELVFNVFPIWFRWLWNLKPHRTPCCVFQQQSLEAWRDWKPQIIIIVLLGRCRKNTFGETHICTLWPCCDGSHKTCHSRGSCALKSPAGTSVKPWNKDQTLVDIHELVDYWCPRGQSNELVFCEIKVFCYLETDFSGFAKVQGIGDHGRVLWCCLAYNLGYRRFRPPFGGRCWTHKGWGKSVSETLRRTEAYAERATPPPVLGQCRHWLPMAYNL